MKLWTVLLWTRMVAWVLVPVLLCAILGPVAWATWKYGSETFKAAKDSAVHGDKAIGEGARSSQKSVEVFQDLDEAVLDFGKIIWKFDDVADAAKGTIETSGTTIEKVGGVADSAKGKIDDLDVKDAQKKAGDFIVAYTSIPAHLNPLMDSSKTALDALTITTTATGNFINAPRLATLITNIGVLAGSGAGFLNEGTILETDIHGKIKPYDGKHPKRHAAWEFTQGMIGLGSRGAEGGYYFLGMSKGE